MESILNHFKKISWTACFAGALIGFGINFLFNLLALAIGFSVFTLNLGKTEFSLLGFVSFSCIAIVTMFITGWMSGLLTPLSTLNKYWGCVFGFISWSILLILTVIIITNMIQFTAFHSNFTSRPNLVAIRITNDAPMLTETKPDESKDSLLKVNIETTTKIITLNAAVTFSLFFIGALSSCIGGYLGYRYNVIKSEKRK